MKIAALTSVSGPYIVARYSAFAQSFPSHRLYLLELGKVSAIYQWQSSFADLPYESVVLSDRPAENRSAIAHFLALNKALQQIQPDVMVICGYGVPGMLPGLLWSMWQRKPAILLSDTKADDAPRSPWKERLKSWIVGRYRAALVAGKVHQQYLTQLGMPSEAIWLGYDVVDNAVFHPDKIRSLRFLAGCVPPRPYFLTINRFVPKKNLLAVISAYAAYRQLAGKEAWELVLCGDGDLRPAIEDLITKLGLNDCVHLTGFLQQDEMLPYFAHASCFIHASIQEEWGLVVNEAMAAGLPVLVSNRCGCFNELVVEGENGFGFDPENFAQITGLMVKISSGQVDLELMSHASLTQIDKFSPQLFATGLMAAIAYAFSKD
jgi:1,2-diacylglycerol 3-alpha-glucosyltransferase